MSQLNAPLDQLLAALAPTIDDEHYVFARATAVPSGAEPFAIVREPSGLTLVLAERTAHEAGLAPLLRCRRIDPGIDTPLAAAGFLAAVATALARESIALNPIAAADRDHLFVATRDAARALATLETLARDARDRLAASGAIDAVLDFWFGAMVEGRSRWATRERWFKATPKIDADIAHRFGHLIDAAQSGSLESWLATPRGALAYIVVTDQFSRQVHRGTARAFASDLLALAAARACIAARFDSDLPLDGRAFAYMPLMHSESLADQRESLRLFASLAESTQHRDEFFTESLQSAHQHCDVIERFGRFPHRNAALGRASTEAEIAYLRTASGFGQTVNP